MVKILTNLWVTNFQYKKFISMEMYCMICRPDNLHMSRTDKSKLNNFSKFYFNNMCASRPIVWILIIARDETSISLLEDYI